MRKLLLKNRNYRLLASGQFISFVGDWFNVIAIAVLVGNDTSGSVMTLASILVLKQIPHFLFSPFSGVAADRFNRKQIMIISDVLRFFSVLGIFINPSSPPWILLCVFITTTFSSFFDPARSASIPQLVADDELKDANALGAMIWQMGMIAGAFLGTIVVETLGVKVAIIIDAASYLMSAFMISRLPPLFPSEFGRVEKGSSLSYRKFIAEELNIREKLLPVLVKGISGVGGAYYLLQVLFGLKFGEGGAVTLSAAFLTRAIGAFVGSCAFRALGQQRTHEQIITTGFLIGAFACFLIGVTDSFLFFIVGTFFVHVGLTLVWVNSNIWIQEIFENENRGKAFGFDLGLNTFLYTISTLTIGSLIEFQYLTLHGAAIVCALAWFIGGGLFASLQHAPKKV